MTWSVALAHASGVDIGGAVVAEKEQVPTSVPEPETNSDSSVKSAEPKSAEPKSAEPKSASDAETESMLTGLARAIIESATDNKDASSVVTSMLDGARTSRLPVIAANRKKYVPFLAGLLDIQFVLQNVVGAMSMDRRMHATYQHDGDVVDEGVEDDEE
ncbi:hypothetical protein GNI_011260 [Gregarina niphandrodes]|uniref:Uncharacterized protein n=1 Tax=Gregarina niphandrodes TaxID=110365 RepID=A0A023BCR2_GRENI|nr:hypothetical protein GNI_011260 [Gregarina niphandrodes]EZG85911.1 hypothetical protein GNI_011260 [Gregarina niphandrodes]|eukprot:XP_011128805.1 hypothetical protein GNI_011260 [Gregarina niphandrodes]